MKEQDNFYQILREKFSAIEEMAEKEFSRRLAENPESDLKQQWAEISQNIEKIHQMIDKAEQTALSGDAEISMSPEEAEKLMEFYQKKYLPENTDNQEESNMTQQM